MHIRRLEDHECAEAASLALEAFAMHVAPHYAEEGRKTFEKYCSASELIARTHSDHETFGAFSDEVLVGIIHLKKKTHVSMLFVKAGLQRGGIGRALVRFAQERCDDDLTVNSSPNSVAAYESFGFVTTQPEQCIHGIRFTPMKKKK